MTRPLRKIPKGEPAEPITWADLHDPYPHFPSVEDAEVRHCRCLVFPLPALLQTLPVASCVPLPVWLQ